MIKLLSIILLISLPTFTKAQQRVSSYKQDAIGGGIYILPTQLFFPEIILSYEHFIKNKFSFSYSLGYKIPVGKGDVFESRGIGWAGIYEYQYMFNPFSNAVYLSFAPAYYFDSRRIGYLQIELFNRFYWFTNKKLFFDNVETDFYDCIRTERNNVTGIKMLAGFNNEINITHSYCINIKIYGGVGVRYKYYHYENVNSKTQDMGQGQLIIPYEEETDSFVIASVHIGLKIGLAKRKILNVVFKK